MHETLLRRPAAVAFAFAPCTTSHVSVEPVPNFILPSKEGAFAESGPRRLAIRSDLYWKDSTHKPPETYKTIASKRAVSLPAPPSTTARELLLTVALQSWDRLQPETYL